MTITNRQIARAIAINAHPAGKAGLVKLPRNYAATVPVPVTGANGIAYLQLLLTGNPWNR